MKHQIPLLVLIISLLPMPTLAASVDDVIDDVPDGEKPLYHICNTLYGTGYDKSRDMTDIEVPEAEVCSLLDGYFMEVRARARFSENTQECGYYTPVSETGEADLELGLTHYVGEQYENDIYDEDWYEENDYPEEMMWSSEGDQTFPSERPLSMGIYSRAPAFEGTTWFSEASSLRDGKDHLLVFLIEENHDGQWSEWKYLLAFEDPPEVGGEDNSFNDSLLEVVVWGSFGSGKTGELGANGGYGEFDPFSAAHAGPDQSKPAGQKVTLDGSNSHGATVAYSWDFDLKPQDSAALLNKSTTVSPDFTSDEPGLYKLSLVVYDGVVYSVEDLVNVTASTSSTVYVDFADSGGPETGSFGEPFNTLAEGILGVTASGTIRIRGDTDESETDETPRITKPMRIEPYPSSGYTVRIGVLVAKMKVVPQVVAPAGVSDPFGGNDAISDTDDTGTPTEHLDALALALAGNEQYASKSGKDESALVADRTTFEPVLPFTQAALADSVLAVRLRSGAEIDPASIWAPIPNYSDDEATVEWRSVDEGDLRDVWVIFLPNETWYLDELISLTVDAMTVSGEPLGPITYEFQVESEKEYYARADEPANAVWQPQYDEDFDADGLDLTAESNETLIVTPADGQAGADPLAEGLQKPYVIGPEQVYDEPQRVWLPVPEGTSPSAVEVYYYHPTGDDKGWYPAENVEGWLVPDSYLSLKLEDVTYLGFLVRHAGIVQLAVPRE